MLFIGKQDFQRDQAEALHSIRCGDNPDAITASDCQEKLFLSYQLPPRPEDFLCFL